MGNCCCPENAVNSSVFQGEGQRLGSTTTTQQRHPANATTAGNNHNTSPGVTERRESSDLPTPRIDTSLTEEERAKIRADRAAAAEARRGKAPKKPKKTIQKELRGPNSQPTMTWTV